MFLFSLKNGRKISKEEANTGVDFGAGGGCIFGVICIGGGYVVVHSALSGQDVYLRLAETPDGDMVYLPEYDADTHQDLQVQISQGLVNLQ